MLELRPLREDDEAEARAAHRELAPERFRFLLLHDGESWSDHLDRLNRERVGVDLPEGRVPATFLVAEVGGALVGRTSIRHELNEHLELVGGHIGYAVRPAHRRRGYATEILRRSLALVHGLGIDPALVTCDDDNVASARTIERCGGVLHDVVPDPDSPDAVPKRRYWVPTTPTALS